MVKYSTNDYKKLSKILIMRQQKEGNHILKKMQNTEKKIYRESFNKLANWVILRYSLTHKVVMAFSMR
jgi:hypothetical protein